MSQSMQPSDLTGGDLRPAVDTGGIWNHQNYQYILFSMKFEDRMSIYPPRESIKTCISPIIRQRFEMARSQLPAHEYWLQKVVGMGAYEMAYMPHGWI
jgi:tryptophan halogenase